MADRFVLIILLMIIGILLVYQSNMMGNPAGETYLAAQEFKRSVDLN